MTVVIASSVAESLIHAISRNTKVFRPLTIRL